ncbi:hypothetical protein FF80_03635 [Devosia sp. LC5]|nr:hypothetical protein FF80_03635 [Devosia sp. LC5]
MREFSKLCSRPLFTSPFGGEVDPLGSGEGAFPKHRARKKAPSPVGFAADLSPKGRGEAAPPSGARN